MGTKSWIESLYPVKTAQQLVNEILTEMASRGLPVNSWTLSGGYMAIVTMLAYVLSKFYSWIQTNVEDIFLSTASDDAVEAIAYNTFQLTRYPATSTKVTLIFRDSGAQGPFNIPAGGAWVTSDVGLRYYSTQAVTLPQRGTVSIPFMAEAAGNDYNQIESGTVWVLKTAYLGVTVANGGFINEYGQDKEPIENLKSRCWSRYSLISAGRTNLAWEAIVKSLEPTVTKILVLSNPDSISGLARIVVAGTDGPFVATGVTETDVVLRLNNQLPDYKTVGTTVEAVTAVNEVYSVTGNVYVYSDSLNQDLIVLIRKSVFDFIGTLPIGGTVYASQLVDIIQEITGVRNVVLSVPSEYTAGATSVLTCATSGLLVSGVSRG